jgi:hypothetical protein
MSAMNGSTGTANDGLGDRTADRDTDVWRVPLRVRVASSVAVVGLAVLSVVMMATGGSGAGWALGFDVVVAIFVWRFALVPTLAAGPQGLAVRNGIRRYLFEWHELESVGPGRTNVGIDIWLRDGRHVKGTAVERSPAASLFRWHTRSDEVVASIRKHALAAGVDL